MPRRVVLISDLQQGSRLEALGDFEWPSDVELDLKTVADHGSNAGLHWLAEPPEAEPRAECRPGRLRVRVSNDAGLAPRGVQARLGRRERATPPATPIDVYVPPGESRVVRVPRPTAAAAGADRSGSDGRRPRVRQHALPRRPSARTTRPSSTSATTRPTTPPGSSTTSSASSRDTPRRSVRVVAAVARRGPRPGAEPRPLPLVVARGRDHARERPPAPDVRAAAAGPCSTSSTAPGQAGDPRRAGRRRPRRTSRRRPSGAT